MKQFKHTLKTTLYYACILLLSICLLEACRKNKVHSYDSAEEALAECTKELQVISKVKKMNLNQVAETVNLLTEIHDSTLAYFIRDSTSFYDAELTTNFYMVMDSLRYEVARLALSEKRTLEEIVDFKIGISQRAEVTSTNKYKAAQELYQKMDKIEPFPNLRECLHSYDSILDNQRAFRGEKDLYDFIAKENRCYKTIMHNLLILPDSVLKNISIKTTRIFERLQKNIKECSNNDRERISTILTIRLNRRVLENAAICMEDIKAGKELKNNVAENYRWMLIQPFIVIDKHAAAHLTDSEIKTFKNLAKELPELLYHIDRLTSSTAKNTSQEEIKNLSESLSELFLNIELKSVL